MNPSAQVLSVNPGSKTLGTLHMPEMLRNNSVLQEIDKSGVPQSHAAYYQRLRALVNLALPTRRSGFELSAFMLLMRMAFAGLVIWRGLALAASPTLISSGLYGTGVMAFFCAMAGLMLFGIGERLVAMLGIVTFTLLSIMMFSSVTALTYNLLLAAMSVLLCVVGPGWFSVDAFVRVYLIRRIAAARNRMKAY